MDCYEKVMSAILEVMDETSDKRRPRRVRSVDDFAGGGVNLTDIQDQEICPAQRRRSK